MQYIGDTKAGTYIATDRYGNKYYENLEQELPCTYPAPGVPWFPSGVSRASVVVDSLQCGRDGWTTKTRSTVRKFL